MGCKTRSKISKARGRYLLVPKQARQEKVRSIGLQRKSELEDTIPMSENWKIKFIRVVSGLSKTD